MALDLRRMRYFVAIAEMGSFTRAAAQLRIAQPALSHHVSQLESHLGVALFTRSARGVVMTEAGETLFAHSQSIIRATEQAELATRERSVRPTGDVVLGLLNSISITLAVPVMERCNAEQPGIRLLLVEGNSQTLRTGVLEQGFDLAINIAHVVPDPPPPLVEEGLFVFGRPDLLTPGSEIALVETLRLPLILPSKRHGVRMLLEWAALQVETPINIAWEMDGVSSVKSAMRAGLGVTVMGRSAVEDHELASTLVARRIVEPPLSRRLVLDRPRGRPVTRAVREVEAILLKSMRDLADRGLWHWL